MKKYKVLHHTLGNDEEGKRAWLNQTEKGHKHLEDHTAKDLNAQFVNSGIKYELVEGEETAFNIDSETKQEQVTKTELVKHIITEEDLVNNPEMVEQGIKVGDEIEIPAKEA